MTLTSIGPRATVIKTKVKGQSFEKVTVDIKGTDGQTGGQTEATALPDSQMRLVKFQSTCSRASRCLSAVAKLCLIQRTKMHSFMYSFIYLSIHIEE